MILTTPRTSKSFLACLLSIVLAFTCFAPTAALAETSAEVHEQAVDLQAEADALSEQIDEISTQLNEAYQVEEEATAKYEAAEAAKEEALARKAAAEKTIATTQERLGTRVASAYRNGGSVSILDVLLGAGSFSEFLTAWDAIEAINNQDKELIEANRKARAEAEAAAEEYNRQSVIAKEELEKATAAREEIEKLSEELNTKLANMTEEIARLIAKEEELRTEEQAAAAAAEAARLEEQNAGVSDNGAGGTHFDSSSLDGWVIPTSYYYVSCEFGYSPITGSHYGIDLAAASGTPIYSAGPGTVTYVGWYGTGGNAVIVNHGGGIQTIYMHQSQTAATVGERVSAGTLIGYVGSTGLSTGPHLHFQMVVNGSPTNPRNYFSF